MTSPALGDSLIGRTFPTETVNVERGRLRAFARSIGETDPIYLDVEAARVAGHPDLLVPPTFLFGVGMGEGGDDMAWLTSLGVDLRQVLHGEQAFDYHSLAFAGDTLTLAPRITDYYSKRGGELTFLTRETVILREQVDAIADLRMTLVIQSLGEA